MSKLLDELFELSETELKKPLTLPEYQVQLARAKMEEMIYRDARRKHGIPIERLGELSPLQRFFKDNPPSEEYLRGQALPQDLSVHKAHVSGQVNPIRKRK